MYLIISNNRMIVGACLFKRRLIYTLFSDHLEGRKYMRELVAVNLFSGKILEYFPAPWIPSAENLKRLARIIVCNDGFS